MADFENGFVGNLAWFSAGHTAPSYGGNPFNAVRSHLTYLLSHDVEEASFTKDDRSRILQELKQYQTRYDATIAGKFFLSLPNDFNTKDIRQFIDSVMPEPVKYEYVVHRSKNKNGQENLHVHILLHPINTVTGKKLRWRKKELSQIHKNYRNTLERFGYEMITHKDKGEEPSIHVGQRMYYMPEAKEYIENARAIGTLEKVISAAQKETRKKELETLKKIDPEILLSHLGIPYKKQGNAYVFSAPYRTDTNPSCRIEPSRYGDWHWVDFGTGIQGTHIDFLLASGFSYKEALNLLRNLLQENLPASNAPTGLRASHVSLQEEQRLGEEEALQLLEVKPAKEIPAVVSYLKQNRGYESIPNWLQWFVVFVVKNGKTYRGYGTQAVNGSIHLRFLSTASIKELCIGSSAPTLITQGNSNVCYIVEGIHDAIALWNYGVTNDSILIMNGVGNVKQVIPLLQQYKEIVVATDIDKAGQEAAVEIVKHCSPKQKIWRLKTVAKDPDEEWRSGNKPVLQPINPEKYYDR